jgi:predicted transcriptional regulator
MARTPKQIAQHAQIITDRIISDLYDYIEKYEIDKSAIASKLGVSRASISTRLSKTGEPKLSNLIKIVAAIEDLTGTRFETPTLTREKGASNAKFRGEVKNEGK